MLSRSSDATVSTSARQTTILEYALDAGSSPTFGAKREREREVARSYAEMMIAAATYPA